MFYSLSFSSVESIIVHQHRQLPARHMSNSHLNEYLEEKYIKGKIK